MEPINQITNNQITPKFTSLTNEASSIYFPFANNWEDRPILWHN